MKGSFWETFEQRFQNALEHREGFAVQKQAAICFNDNDAIFEAANAPLDVNDFSPLCSYKDNMQLLAYLLSRDLSKRPCEVSDDLSAICFVSYNLLTTSPF